MVLMFLFLFPTHFYFGSIKRCGSGAWNGQTAMSTSEQCLPFKTRQTLGQDNAIFTNVENTPRVRKRIDSSALLILEGLSFLSAGMGICKEWELCVGIRCDPAWRGGLRWWVPQGGLLSYIAHARIPYRHVPVAGRYSFMSH